VPEALPRKLLPFPWLFATRRTARRLIAAVQNMEYLIEAGGVLTPRERSYVIDGLMVLAHQMRQAPENDLSELADIQALLERLMAAGLGHAPADLPAAARIAGRARLAGEAPADFQAAGQDGGVPRQRDDQPVSDGSGDGGQVQDR
jgi:hypothetical protein